MEMHDKGIVVHPVPSFKGKITTTFWGQRWCDGLERYADFESRLDRGRSYVRSGAVFHLEISSGRIEAQMIGNSPYSIKISIAPLSKGRWRSICDRCTGQIASLIELLWGIFSKDVMKIVCDPYSGMFPSPREINMQCSCPDYADMCKHAAAVLYGVGRRLDSSPDLFFTLRGVDPADLLPQTIDIPEADNALALQADALGALFGIDLVMDVPPAPKSSS